MFSSRKWIQKLSSSRLRSLALQCFGALRFNRQHYFCSTNERKGIGDGTATKNNEPLVFANPEALAGVTIVNNEAAAKIALAKLLEVAAAEPERMFACDTEVSQFSLGGLWIG